jgi:hypothetical protein
MGHSSVEAVWATRLAGGRGSSLSRQVLLVRPLTCRPVLLLDRLSACFTSAPPRATAAAVAGEEGARQKKCYDSGHGCRGRLGAHHAASPQHVHQLYTSFFSILPCSLLRMGLSFNSLIYIMYIYMYRYGSRATARDFEIYAANATFEDPLMRAHG